MDYEVPPHRSKIQILVLVLGVPEHASGVDLAFALACLVQDGFFQLMMTVFAKHMALAVSRNAAFHITHQLRRGDSRAIGIAVMTISEGQNLNFAVPIDYAKGMLASPSVPKTLASIYEPEPAPEKTPATASPAPAVASSSAASATASIPDEMKKSSLTYVEGKLHIWTVGDAIKELGQYISYREGTDRFPSNIFGFEDPTKGFRQIELSFSKRDLKLENIYVYPWNLTWDQCKGLWGSNVKTIKNPNGTKFYMYKDRRLNVLVNNHGEVASIGIY